MILAFAYFNSYLLKGSIVKDLQRRREDEMKRFLDNEINLEFCPESQEYHEINPILRIIAPEKQAVSAEEKMELLKADCLELKEEEEQKVEEKQE